MRGRHAAHYVAALAAWVRDSKGPRQLDALREIEADLDNARAAWDWAIERRRVEWLDQAVEGLCLIYNWRGRYQEGATACQMTPAPNATLESLPVSPSTRRHISCSGIPDSAAGVRNLGRAALRPD